MKIEMGKQYRTRNGREVRIYATDGNEIYPVHGAINMGGVWKIETWTLEGRHDRADRRPHDNDLIEGKPRIKRTIWVNLYERGYGVSLTKERADANAVEDRLACVKVEIDCEEGEGL